MLDFFTKNQPLYAPQGRVNGLLEGESVWIREIAV
jgi:hypothetical protein